jgi:pimeloyl-ACP methyl ester carboxylesterase
VQADGVPVHTVDWVPARVRDDRRVLLLHGLGAHTLSWEPMAAPLADRLGTRVTAIDFIGFGRTRAPARRATMAAQRRLVEALLERFGPSLVVGNSMGADVGIGVAATNPESVTGLVLVNPAVPHPRPGFFDWLRIAWLAPVAVPALGAGVVALRARALGPERLVDSSLQATLGRVDVLDPDLRRRMIDLTAERLTWGEAATSYADGTRSLVTYMTIGVQRDLGRAAAGCPTLLLHGAEDRLVPLEAARHAAGLHDLDFVVLDGVGHAPQLENPGRVVDSIARWVDTRAVPTWPWSATPVPD